MGTGENEMNCNLGRVRLMRFLNRAAAGEELTVGFFGGSITQGSLASVDELCYARRFYDGLCALFPDATLHYVNAGIGGTGSHYGAMRIREDLLEHRPDLVVLDFSVNDGAAVLPLYEGGQTAAQGGTDWKAAETREEAYYPETWEGVLRRILSFETKPAVLVLNNAFYDTGESVEDRHNEIADHYGVLHVSVRDRILPRMRAGEFTREEVSPDGLHPNDKGHAFLAEEMFQVIAEMTAMGMMMGPIGEEEESLPAPLTENTYERLERYTALNCKPELAGFAVDTNEPAEPWDFFRHGWTAANAGDRLSVDLNGGNIAVVYRKTVHRPSPVAKLVIDGDADHAVILDGNFDQDWGDCLYLQPVLHHGAAGKHHLEIEIIKASEEDQAPFYLLCFGAD